MVSGEHMPGALPLEPCPECGFGLSVEAEFCSDCGRDRRKRSLWQRLRGQPAARSTSCLRDQEQAITRELVSIDSDLRRFAARLSEVEAQLDAARSAGRDNTALSQARDSLERALEQRRALKPRYRALEREIWLDRAENELRMLLTHLGPSDDGERLRRALQGELSAAGRLQGHSGAVNTLAFTAAGQRLASGGADGKVRLWRLPELDCEQTLHGHDAPVRALAFHPSGELLASGGLDETICLWTLRDQGGAQPEPRRLSGHKDWISGLAISPDGCWLASASGDGTARLWCLDEADPAAKMILLSRGGQLARSVAFSPAGKLLALARLDGALELWDAGARSLIGRAKLGRGVGPLRFSPRGGLLACASDAELCLWSVRAAEVAARFATPSAIVDLSFDQGGHLFGAACADGTLLLLAYEGEELPGKLALREIARLPAQRGAARAVAFDPAGRFVACGGDDGETALWDLDQPSISRLARQALSCLDELMRDVELTRSEEGRHVGERGWRFLQELTAALAHVHVRRLHALPLSADNDDAIPKLRRRIEGLLAEAAPLLAGLRPRAAEELPGALEKQLSDLPRRLLAAQVDTLLETVQQQLRELHGASETECALRLARLRGCRALAAALLPALAGQAKLATELATVERAVKTLPELVDLVLARRATAAIGNVSPLTDDAPLAAISAERSALRTAVDASDELKSALAEVEAFLAETPALEEVDERARALAAIAAESGRLADEEQAIADIDRLLRS